MQLNWTAFASDSQPRSRWYPETSTINTAPVTWAASAYVLPILRPRYGKDSFRPMIPCLARRRDCVDGISLFNSTPFKYRNRKAGCLHSILARSLEIGDLTPNLLLFTLFILQHGDT